MWKKSKRAKWTDKKFADGMLGTTIKDTSSQTRISQPET